MRLPDQTAAYVFPASAGPPPPPYTRQVTLTFNELHRGINEVACLCQAFGRIAADTADGAGDQNCSLAFLLFSQSGIYSDCSERYEKASEEMDGVFLADSPCDQA